ncbi:MAG: hypothetical protein J3K34DRAFT_458937 [Monoraphidium minutum]|nr:MAG: hypothetical protein J3K34DRAFT_458937 [Monoraphidium minutum]
MKRAHVIAIDDERCVAVSGIMELDVGAAVSPHAQVEVRPPPSPGAAARRKRACGAAASVGAMRPADVAAQLRGAGLHVDAAAAGGAAAGLWAAVAELNALLAARGGYEHAIRGSCLTFRSVPRCARYQLWLRFARGRGVSEEAAAAAAARGGGGAEGLPGWLGLALHVFGVGLGAYPDASATEYKVRMPGWLLAWAARWGVGCGGDGSTIALLHVEAFAPSAASAAGCAASLFLPVPV